MPREAYEKRDADLVWRFLLSLYLDVPEGEDERLKRFFHFEITPKPNESIRHENYTLHLMIPRFVLIPNSLIDIHSAIFYVVHYYWETPGDFLPSKYKGEPECVAEILWGKLKQQAKSAPFTKESWWRTRASSLISSTYHETAAEQGIKKNEFAINYKGKLLWGKSTVLPSIAGRGKLCRDVFDLLENETIRRNVLWDRPTNDEIAYLKAEKGSAPLQNEFPPSHIGWSRLNGYNIPTGYYSGKDNGAEYGHHFLRRGDTVRFSTAWKDPFAFLPHNISIPLFAYDVFSVIKYFVPGYPARISENGRYRTVARKLSKVIFLSLKGDDRYRIAKAYCGMFTDYGFFDTPEELDKAIIARKYRSRVHDGIVIAERQYATYGQFSANELVRDACCISLNSNFDPVENEIVIFCYALQKEQKYDEKLEKRLSDMQASITDMLKGFIAYFSKTYFDKEHEVCANCVKEICEATKSIENFNKIKPKDWPEKYFPHGERWTLARLETACATAYRENAVVKVAGRVISKPFAYKFKKIYKPIMSKAKNDYYQDIFRLGESAKKLRVAPTSLKYIYLYESMRLFCEYLSEGEGEREFAETLLNASMHTFQDLSDFKADPTSFLYQYLSTRIEQHKIVRRGTSDTGSVCGWNDGDNQESATIYLPYSSFYSDMQSAWNENEIYGIPFSKSMLLDSLDEVGIAKAKKDHATGYARYDVRLAMGEIANSGKRKQISVIKLTVDKTKLSNEAQTRLDEMARTKVARRAPARVKEA